MQTMRSNPLTSLTIGTVIVGVLLVGCGATDETTLPAPDPTIATSKADELESNSSTPAAPTFRWAGERAISYVGAVQHGTWARFDNYTALTDGGLIAIGIPGDTAGQVAAIEIRTRRPSRIYAFPATAERKLPSAISTGTRAVLYMRHESDEPHFLLLQIHMPHRCERSSTCWRSIRPSSAGAQRCPRTQRRISHAIYGGSSTA